MLSLNFKNNLPKNLVFILIAVNIIFGCKHQSTSDTKVINGIPSKVDQSKYVVMLKRFNSTCSGAFLNSSIVLTAAHCVVNRHNNYMISRSWDIQIGKTKANKIILSDPKNFSRLYKIAMENQTLNSILEVVKRDFALVVFPRGTAQKYGIPISSIKKVASQRPSVGDGIFIIGYGRSKDSDKESSRIKRWGRNQISHTEEGLIGYPSAYGNSPGYNSGASSGDSGGPILYSSSQTIIGVTSWGHGGTEWMPDLSSIFAKNLFSRSNQQKNEYISF